MFTISNLFKFKLLLIISFLFQIEGFSMTVFTSTGNGNWNNSATWTQTGSGTITKYIILSSDQVTISSNVNGFDTLIVNGTLVFNSNKSLNMNANGVIVVNTGGVLKGGSAGSNISWSSGVSGLFSGPWNGGNTVNGPVAANKASQGFNANLLPLPIKLTGFNVSLNDNDITVNWAAFTATDGDYFSLEKSVDGNHWKEMTRINVTNSGNSNEYFYSDVNAVAGMQFYRLKEVDINGAYTYSKIISYNHTSAANIANIFPNPTTGIFQVKLGNSNFSGTGKAVLKNSMSVEIIIQDIQNAENFIFDISNQNTGVYTLEVISNDKIHSYKIVKF